jgi:plasmid stabilization system protein ParE
MTVIILDEAEADLERAFDYYEGHRAGLGVEMLEEYRRGVERILEYPNAWGLFGEVYRRYRIHRFPYGIVYRVDLVADRAVIVAVMHLAEEPGRRQSLTIKRPLGDAERANS